MEQAVYENHVKFLKSLFTRGSRLVQAVSKIKLSAAKAEGFQCKLLLRELHLRYYKPPRFTSAYNIWQSSF